MAVLHIPGTGARVTSHGRQVSGRFPHTAGADDILYRADSSGTITTYQVYDAWGNPLIRVDLVGRTHGGVPTPHVIAFERHIDPATGITYIKEGNVVRSAYPDEIP